MNYLKNIYKPFSYLFLIIIGSTFFITILSYFNILNHNISVYLKFLTSIIGFFVGGFLIGKKSIKKGYIEGLKFSLIIIFIMILISIIFKSFKYKSLIYYLILIISSIIGSMIGINKKNKD